MSFIKSFYRGCAMRNTSKNLIRLSSTSNTSSSLGFVNLDSIFDDTNKLRVVEKLKTSKPLTRPDLLHSSEQDIEAGVLVPMCHIDGEPSFLFMARSLNLNSHRGETSFPGGIKDDDDRDIIHTALRETEEEIGLNESLVNIWGTLPALPSKAKQGRRMVTPVLGYCNIDSIDELKLNPTEVDCVFTRTVASFCDPANQRQTQWRYPGSKGFTLPVFIGGEHRVWGFTAIVVHQIMTILAPDHYKFRLKHRS